MEDEWVCSECNQIGGSLHSRLYCSDHACLHDAASDLLSTARAAIDALERRGKGKDYYTVALKQAVAKAEGSIALGYRL